jgi:hypothetical protein
MNDSSDQFSKFDPDYVKNVSGRTSSFAPIKGSVLCFP